MKNSFAYFENRDCVYFPCHQTQSESFNCLFCYCPLYALGEDCGGNFTYIEDGIKDCSHCLIPHSENGYSYILSQYPKLKELAKKKEEK